MKKIKEYDFSYEINESLDDAVKELQNFKIYLNQSLNGTIKNIGDVDLTIESNKIKVGFMLNYDTILEDDWSFDRAFSNFIDENEGYDHELSALQTLKSNLLEQIEKLDKQIKKVSEQ